MFTAEDLFVSVNEDNYTCETGDVELSSCVVDEDIPDPSTNDEGQTMKPGFFLLMIALVALAALVVWLCRQKDTS